MAASRPSRIRRPPGALPRHLCATALALSLAASCRAEPPVPPESVSYNPPALNWHNRPEGAATRPFAARPLRSVVPTPRSWTGPEVSAAFELAGQLGPVVSLPDPVDWFDAAGKPASASKAYRDATWQRVLCERNRLNVFVQMDPYRDRRGPIPGLPRSVAANSFSDPLLRRAFIADAVQRAALYRPPLMCLAMEINAYYEQRPDDFEHFVTLFAEARAALRRVKPDTLVFVSFQYEQLLGRFGGQGGLPAHEPHWELLARFEPHADAIGISSYPLEQFSPPRYGDPAALPDDYYRRITEHTALPIVFAELGWPSDARFGGSPQRQAAFIQRLPELLAGMPVLLVNWNFLHDAQGYGEVFESMGLIDRNGREKPALHAWKRTWQ